MSCSHVYTLVSLEWLVSDLLLASQIGPVYLAEMAPAKLRGSLNVIFQLFVCLLLPCCC